MNLFQRIKNLFRKKKYKPPSLMELGDDCKIIINEEGPVGLAFLKKYELEKVSRYKFIAKGD